MPLPQKHIDRVFARILIRYGAVWMRMWEGIDEGAVKADWARELDAMPDFRLAYALDHLPADRPPGVAAFRALCMAAPAHVQARLPAPKPDPVAVRDITDRVKGGLKPHDPLAGARRLRQREQAGDKSLTALQREFWRQALARELEHEAAA